MRRHLFFAIVASAGLLAASACTSTAAPERVAASQAPSAPVEDSPAPLEGATVGARVIDTDFAPVTIEIETGETVRWKQTGDQPHSVTAADESFDSSPGCGPLDSDQCLGQGDTFVHTFEKPGTFAYYCRVHGLPDGTGMFGTVVVK